MSILHEFIPDAGGTTWGDVLAWNVMSGLGWLMLLLDRFIVR